MADNTTKNYKTKADEMSDGTFAAFYGEKSFLKVKQALAIGKVVFAFVTIGTKGEGVNIYVDADDFDNLCDDILSGRFQKACSESQSKYPDTWKYSTGENASKTLAIGKGMKTDAVVQGRQKDGQKDKNIFVGISSFDELRTMAKWWRRISKSYYEELAAVCLKASQNRTTYADVDEKVPMVTPAENPATASAPKEVKSEELELTGKTACVERQTSPGDYSMTAKGKDDKTYNVVFPKSAIDAMSDATWKKFKERSEDRETPLQFKGSFVKGNENGRDVFYFQKFA